MACLQLLPKPKALLASMMSVHLTSVHLQVLEITRDRALIP